MILNFFFFFFATFQFEEIFWNIVILHLLGHILDF